MELGNIFHVDNILKNETTAIIDQFLKKDNNGMPIFDTMLLKDAFGIWINNKWVYIHLYIKRNIFYQETQSSISFSEYKKCIAARPFVPGTSMMCSFIEDICFELKTIRKILIQNTFSTDFEFKNKFEFRAQNTRCRYKSQYGDHYKLCVFGAHISTKHLKPLRFGPIYNNHTPDLSHAYIIENINEISDAELIDKLTNRDSKNSILRDVFSYKCDTNNNIHCDLYINFEKNEGSHYGYTISDYKNIVFQKEYLPKSDNHWLVKSLFRLLCVPEIDLSDPNIDIICSPWDYYSIPINNKWDIVVKAIHFYTKH